MLNHSMCYFVIEASFHASLQLVRPLCHSLVSSSSFLSKHLCGMFCLRSPNVERPLLLIRDRYELSHLSTKILQLLLGLCPGSMLLGHLQPKFLDDFVTPCDLCAGFGDPVSR